MPDRLTIALAVLGAIGSIVGIWAFVDARRSRRAKLLAYEHTEPIPLASASTAGVAIHYTRPGTDRTQVIDAAYATYLRFANFGREPIRSGDIATANPLRIDVKMRNADAGKVLDIALQVASRDVPMIKVGGLINFGVIARAKVSFDFLDYHDGAVVRILTSGRPASITMTGDIIGMPSGIARSEIPPAKGLWGKLGFALWILAEIGACALTAFIFRWTTGGWADVWVLALPLPAVVVPIILAFVVSDSLWPNNRREYPKELALPHWLQARLMAPYRYDVAGAWEPSRSGDVITRSVGTYSQPPDAEPDSEIG